MFLIDEARAISLRGDEAPHACTATRQGTTGDVGSSRAAAWATMTRQEILHTAVGTAMKKKTIRDACTVVCDASFTGAETFTAAAARGPDEFDAGRRPAVGTGRLQAVLSVRSLASALINNWQEDDVRREVLTFDKIVRDHPSAVTAHELAEHTFVFECTRLGCEARSLVAEKDGETRTSATEVCFKDPKGDWVGWREWSTKEDQKLRRTFQLDKAAQMAPGINAIRGLPASHPTRRDFMAGIAVAHRGFDKEVSITSWWEQEATVDSTTRAALREKHIDDVQQYARIKKERDTEALLQKAAAGGRASAGAGDKRKEHPTTQAEPATPGKKKQKKGGKGKGGTGGTTTDSTPLASPATSPSTTMTRADAEALRARTTNPADLPFAAVRALGLCQGCMQPGHIRRNCPTAKTDATPTTSSPGAPILTTG
jgi:hypothetical protein